MAFYYVKNGGTATGDAGRYASQQTGSFAALGAAGYYNNIQDAIDISTTSPVAGDFINPSDIHSHTYVSTNVILLGAGDDPFYIVSVDDANIDAGRTTGNRAFESSAPGGDITITSIFVSGVDFFVGDDMIFNLRVNQLNDCRLSASASGDRPIVLTNAAAALKMIGGEIALDHVNTSLFVDRGCSLILDGVVTTTTTGGTDHLFDIGFGNGGGRIQAAGCDFSAVIGVLLSNIGSAADEDDIDVRFDLCKLAAGVAFTNETFKGYQQRALFTRCSDSSAAAEYQYHLHAFGGDVDDDSSIFRNEDEPFTESNQKISYKIVTNSDASVGSPLWFDFPVLRYSRLSAGATDNLRFYITSNTALTDKDIYMEIYYPDGTNKQTPNTLCSAPKTVGGTLDLMAAGTILTTDGSSSWNGALSNLYQIDLDTSIDVGSDCQPIVKVYVTIPSVTIQMASEYGLS